MMEELMVARLPESVKFAFAVAFGSVHILEHILGYVEGISPRSPALDAAVAVLVVALPVTYIMSLVLMYMYLREAPPAAAARQRRALRRFADLACALAILLVVGLAGFLFLVMADGSSDSGLRPTSYLMYRSSVTQLSRSSSFNPNSDIDPSHISRAFSACLCPSQTAAACQLSMIDHVFLSERWHR